MTPYEIAKAIHVTCAVASGAGFVARGLLMLRGSPLLQARIVRLLPHLVDTTLLAAAVAMLAIARLDPRDAPWLLAKIIALLVYIVLGAIALKRGRTRTIRAAAYAGALATLGYIAMVAVTRAPAGPLQDVALVALLAGRG